MQRLQTTAPRIPLHPALWLLAAAALLALSVNARAATAAGRAVFASGAPQAVDLAGAARVLKRGDEVFAGDRLETPNGARLQVSFADGAYISLQPDSQYEITQYQYSGQPDGTERATYSLLKGGVRAVTGLIGKKNPDAYKVQTPVATIGIRGTGHNTRYCHGDCPGRHDGLYHNTWEGITFVTNDVDTKEVPTGSGVFVESIDKPIVYLDQPSGATAADTGGQKEKEQRKEEEQNSAFLVGDQRTGEGDQTVVPTASSTVTPGLELAGVGKNDDPASQHPYDLIDASNVSVFVRDSDKVLVGLMLIREHEFDSGRDHMTLATTDPDAIRGGNDANSVSAAESLLAQVDPQLFTQLQEKPAEVADEFLGDGFGWFRWTNGRVLVAPEDPHGPPHIVELTGYQSFHFIFGEPVPSLPATGSAEYDFIGGTESTSLSGATIGKGVTGGFISIDFGTDQGFLDMKVQHDNTDYQVSGGLGIDRGGEGFGLVSLGINASVLPPTSGPLPTSECYPSSCSVSINGGFAGPSTTGGIPAHIGFSYAINVSDPIIGVAGFEYAGPAPVQ